MPVPGRAYALNRGRSREARIDAWVGGGTFLDTIAHW
jgi:hypothetical protein